MIFAFERSSTAGVGDNVESVRRRTIRAVVRDPKHRGPDGRNSVSSQREVDRERKFGGRASGAVVPAKTISGTPRKNEPEVDAPETSKPRDELVGDATWALVGTNGDEYAKMDGGCDKEPPPRGRGEKSKRVH